MITRTQVAGYLAETLAQPPRADRSRAHVLRQVAAWLVTTGRVRQASYLARDVACQIETRGYLLAHLTTARPLSIAGRHSVEAFLRTRTGARHLELTTIIDPNLIGGLRLETPTTQLDATVRRQLTALVEGAHQ